MNKKEFLETYQEYRTDTLAEAIKECNIADSRTADHKIVILYFKYLKMYTLTTKDIAETVIEASNNVEMIVCQ